MTSFVSRQFNIDAGLLSSVVLLGAFREAAATEEELPQELWLTGVVRDFQERTAPGGHPDMERQPDHGFGQYTGNVDLLLGDDDKPVFTGQGRKVSEQAHDAQGRPIAPHLANKRFGTIAAAPPAVDCAVVQDAGGHDALQVCLASAELNADGTSSWTYHALAMPESSETVKWLKVKIGDHTPATGTTPGYSTNNGWIKWAVESGFTEGDFTLVLDGHWAGELDSAGVKGKSGRHAETAAMVVPTMTSAAGGDMGDGGALLDDPALGDSDASMSYSDAGGITSAASFNQWYRDELGVNLSTPLSLRFERQADGSYVFDDAADPEYADLGGFFPIEGRLFGNPGGHPDRNFHFTFELHTDFTYHADGNQFFRFIGDDDVWVYIDGKLVIDIGGVHAATEQYVDLSRLGLTDGERYSLDFFFAERHRTQSNCRIETNLALETAPETALPSMTAAFD